MTLSETPAGQERQVTPLGGTNIDGAPISYVVVLASVVAGLALIPLSVVLGSGTSFPMSQAVYPMVGWILGPIAGALASGIGASIGTLLAPHTTTVPAATVLGALAGSFAAGAMDLHGRRKAWWVPLAVLFVLVYGLYAGRAVLLNGVRVSSVLIGSFINWSALLIFLLPSRRIAADWIRDPDLRKVSIGIFVGTWMAAGLTHLIAATIVYFVLNWPESIWLAMAPLAPFEHLTRSIVGAVLGTGVIAGLRAVGLVKPTYATY
jgi:hypothetical protein